MEQLKSLLEKNTQTLSNLTIREDEYIEDGQIYCQKCKTLRAHKHFIPIYEEERLVRHLCKCQAEAERERKEREEELERLREAEKLQKASLIGDRYKGVTFDKTDRGINETFDTAYERCRKYCDNWREVLKNGYGIYLYGDKGTGKTHLTACMANELISNYKQVLFTNFFEISKSIRETFGGKETEATLVNRISNIDFLFIDDIGTERVTANGSDLWLQGQIFDVINKRYNNRKPTVFTSNYSIQELVSNRGIMDKTVDRILEMSSAIIKIEGKSQRQMNRGVGLPF